MHYSSQAANGFNLGKSKILWSKELKQQQELGLKLHITNVNMIVLEWKIAEKWEMKIETDR